MSTPSPLPQSRRRWPWIFLGGFILGGAVFVGLSLAPPVQGWLVRRFIARQSGWRLDFERIGVGPNGLDASGLDFAMPGVTARSAPVAIRIAPTQLFSKRELRIERVEARKIQVVLTPAELGPSRVFDGVLHLLQVPLPWALDTAQLDGDLVVRDAGESRLKGNFSLRGGGITNATTGEFAYELTADSLILPPGRNHRFSSAGTLRLTQTPVHGIAHISVEGDLRLPHYGKLALPLGRLALDIKAITGGEKYSGRLSLGNAVRLDLDATLEAATSKLTGRATLQADQTAAASLLGENLPHATVAAEITFTLDLRTGDVDAAITGDLDARDWQKLLPQLSALDAFKGRLVATVNRHGDQLVLKSFNATLRGEKSKADATIALVQPVDLKNIPTSPLANIALTHWPVEWANPFFNDSGIKLAPGEFSAAWAISTDAGHSIQLSATQSATLGPISASGAKSPALPTLNFSFHPTIEVSAAGIKLSSDDFNATSPNGDRVDAQFAFSRNTSNDQIRATGEFKGTLPTAFSSPHEPAPFVLNARWDALLDGTRLRLSTLEFNARTSASAPPLLTIGLERVFDVDLARHGIVTVATSVATTPGKPISDDLLRLRFDHFPLAWLSRWLPGQRMTGTFAAGESTLNTLPDGSFAVHTAVPWQLEGVRLSALASPAGLKFDAHLSPELSLRGDTMVTEIKNFAASDAANNRLTAQIGATAELSTKNIKAEITLDADLPSLPHSTETFGPIKGSLRAKFHTVTPRITGADEFDLHVSNATGELLSLNAPLPFVFGLSNSEMVVLSTLAPLHLKTSGFPLAWLRPWSSGGLEIDGALGPMEFLLSAKIDRYSVRATTLVKIDKFSARRDGQDLIRDATVTFEPGMDLSFLCKTQPKFEMAYSGMAHVTEAKADIAGRRAIDLDLGVAFKGNGTVNLPDLIDLSSRVDFAALPNAHVIGLPTQGTLVTRVNGDLLGGNPVEVWFRLAGLPATKTGNLPPPLEATVRGKISGFNVFAGGVELNLGTSPQPSDAAFDINFNLVEAGLDITSALRSGFMDGGALLELARSFPTKAATPALAPAIKKPTGAQSPSNASEATLPFWSVLTGSFDLDIGTLLFSPYRIDHVKGRLDVTRSKLSLHDLGGEMFAGRWGGAIQIEHKPDNSTGEHTLAGEFHIEQFESARVIQTVFPNQLASVDARINVHSTVASRGNSFVSLIDQSTADFSVDGANGLIRLTVPKSDLMSTAAVFGGTVLLSPELRALGRLLKKFAEMPVEQLSIRGRRSAGGEVTLDELRFDSPQARMLGRGRILAEHSVPLMDHLLELSVQLAAKDDLAVILGGMNLLEQKNQSDGFRSMREPFALSGRAGAPDTTQLYDLFAKAVSGSKGTWGFLMRKAQAEVERRKTSAGAPKL